jgi:FKBP-type peptidyl-prolyl cis-trans isomerase FklB
MVMAYSDLLLGQNQAHRTPDHNDGGQAMHRPIKLATMLALSSCVAGGALQASAPTDSAPTKGFKAVQTPARSVRLPGPQYEVLRSGPPGARPRRSDEVQIRYVGRLEDGSIFSTSAHNGAEPSTFSVRTVIPGFSALVQLMRPGDRWRFIIPAYLGYGDLGRRYAPPEDTLKRDVPPASTLVFDVELVAITPGG